MPKVEFLFDFGSPNAYLCHRVIPEIERRQGVRFTYVPILLGGIFKATGNRSPAEAFAGIRNKPEYGQLEIDRFLRRHGITNYVRNPHFPVNTLMLMRGAHAARELGVFERYVDEVYRHMWSEPKKMDDPAVVKAALVESGLPADRLFELAQSAPVKEALMAATQAAVERGAFGSPTFFVDGEIWFGKETLRDVEDAIAAGRNTR